VPGLAGGALDRTDEGEPVRVLMLTTFGPDNYVYESLRAGASGFMLKDAPPEEIPRAVRIIANGQARLARHRLPAW
jgi:DNA-binding NarL/FixJ family response regulator